MHARARGFLALFVLAVGLGLAGCDTVDRLQDSVTEFFDRKKPLPGQRAPVFPEGVPGVIQGVPPEYLKDNKPPEPDPNALAKPPEPEKVAPEKPAAQTQAPPAQTQAPPRRRPARTARPAKHDEPPKPATPAQPSRQTTAQQPRRSNVPAAQPVRPAPSPSAPAAAAPSAPSAPQRFPAPPRTAPLPWPTGQ